MFGHMVCYLISQSLLLPQHMAVNPTFWVLSLLWSPAYSSSLAFAFLLHQSHQHIFSRCTNILQHSRAHVLNNPLWLWNFLLTVNDTLFYYLININEITYFPYRKRWKLKLHAFQIILNISSIFTHDQNIVYEKKIYLQKNNLKKIAMFLKL